MMPSLASETQVIQLQCNIKHLSHYADNQVTVCRCEGQLVDTEVQFIKWTLENTDVGKTCEKLSK